MRGTLYLISNNTNDKVYVGKTYQSPDKRWKEHIRDINRFIERPLYRALNKYGVENFELLIVGEYEEGLLELEEIKYIELFDSYRNGYNATLGGEGARTLTVSDEDIISSYSKLKSMTEVASIFNIDRTSVRRILNANNIEIDSSHKRKTDLGYKSVQIVELNKQFNSQLECAQYLIDNKIASGLVKSVAGSLNKVCRGQRKTYKGLTFTDL